MHACIYHSEICCVAMSLLLTQNFWSVGFKIWQGPNNTKSAMGYMTYLNGPVVAKNIVAL
jgi:hypothetical protein